MTKLEELIAYRNSDAISQSDLKYVLANDYSKKKEYPHPLNFVIKCFSNICSG